MGYRGAQRGARGIMGCKWHKGVKDGHKEVEESHKIEFKGYRSTKATKGVQEGHRGYWGHTGVQEVHNEGTRGTMGQGDTREVFKRVVGKN